VSWTEAAAKVAVLPRVVDVKTDISPASVVSHPLTIFVHVRSFRMAWLITEVPVLLRRVRVVVNGLWSVGRGRVHLPSASMPFVVLAVLGEREKTKNQGDCEKS
jgi:hypothetical protein